MSRMCFVLQDIRTVSSAQWKIAFLLKRNQPDCRFNLNLANNYLVQFQLQIHFLTWSERGRQNHIGYLNSLRTWDQPCGQQGHEEESVKKPWAQWEGKLGQDQGNLGRRHQGEGGQHCQMEHKRKAVFLGIWQWELSVTHERIMSVA